MLVKHNSEEECPDGMGCVELEEKVLWANEKWLCDRKEYKEGGIRFALCHFVLAQSPTEEAERHCIRAVQRRLADEGFALWVLVFTGKEDGRTEYCMVTLHAVKMIRMDSWKNTGESEKLQEEDACEREQRILQMVRREWFAPVRISEVVQELIARQITVSTMESCTAGLLASCITDTEGASAILKGAFITYSNEAKIRQGVPAEVIGQHGVYSFATAKAMADACREAYQAVIGIGVTGTTGNTDPNNGDSVSGEIYYAIRWQEACWLCRLNLDVAGMTRHQIKERIVKEVVQSLELLVFFF